MLTENFFALERKKRNMNVAQFAKLLGIHRPAYYRLKYIDKMQIKRLESLLAKLGYKLSVQKL